MALLLGQALLITPPLAAQRSARVPDADRTQGAWEESTQVYASRMTATTTLTAFGHRWFGKGRRDARTSSNATFRLTCYEGNQLEVSVASADSLGESPPRIQTDFWFRADDRDLLKLEALVIGGHTVSLDHEASRRVLAELLPVTDTLDVLVFRGEESPVRAVFPIGEDRGDAPTRSFCASGR